MTKYGVIANRPGMHPFIFCMTETEKRAVSIMNHYRIQSPGLIYRTAKIPDTACTGDDFYEVI